MITNFWHTHTHGWMDLPETQWLEHLMVDGHKIYQDVKKLKCRSATTLQVTWLVVTEVQSESFGLVIHSTVTTMHVMSQVPSLQCASYVAMCFHRRVWYHALSMHYACIRSSGIILIPQARFVLNFVSFCGLHCWASELAHGEKLPTQSLTHSNTQSPSLYDAREPILSIIIYEQDGCRRQDWE